VQPVVRALPVSSGAGPGADHGECRDSSTRGADAGFYVNIGGGEPAADFWELVDYATGTSRVKFSPTASNRRRGGAAAGRHDYVDVQISLDGATPRSATRSAAGPTHGVRAMVTCRPPGSAAQGSVVMTRHNIAARRAEGARRLLRAQLRLTRCARPAAARTLHQLHPDAASGSCMTGCRPAQQVLT